MTIDGQNKATPTGNRRTRRLWFTMHGLLALALVFSLPFVQADAAGLAGEMVLIPGGSFQMGDLSGEGRDDEKPVHRVTVPAFRLGKHEVTFAQWDACVADGGCGGYRPDDRGWGRGNRPVVNVSWDNAQSFIGWLNGKTGGGYRLPTEAEWEYAVRAGTRTKYHFGDSESELCRYANHADRGTSFNWRNESCSDGAGEQTAPVGSFAANAWGLHDMHGNVWEWVQDCWNESYRARRVMGVPGRVGQRAGACFGVVAGPLLRCACVPPIVTGLFPWATPPSWGSAWPGTSRAEAKRQRVCTGCSGGIPFVSSAP